MKRTPLRRTRWTRKRPRKRKGDDPAYRAWLRDRSCVGCGKTPAETIHHVRLNSGAGMGQKPPDARALPMCPDCHTLGGDSLHGKGEVLFWERVEADPESLIRWHLNLYQEENR